MTETVASMSSNGRADWAHVCASKMGATGLTRALAVELGPHGILVNHIVPGAFDTTRQEGQQAMARREERAAGIPVGRMGLPEEVAKTCAFLASEDAGYRADDTRKRRRVFWIGQSVIALSFER